MATMLPMAGPLSFPHLEAMSTFSVGRLLQA